ncbi:MAG: ABC transporter permease [Planctomycetes bacterium]|nr:ABC transporter permease [Planctomycetota bacterium]
MSERLELLRLVRSRRPLLALAALLLFLVLMLVGFWSYAQARSGGAATFEYTYENKSYFNGLTFALYAFFFGFVLLLPLFAALEGGAQLAGDTGSGTLTLLLVRPVSKTRLFFGKLAVAFGWTTLLTALFVAAALLLGLFAVGWGDLRLYPGVLQSAPRPQFLPRDVALQRFALAWLAASLALLAPLSLSFWIATFTRSAVNAVGAAVALYLVAHVISEVHFFEALRPWLFTWHATAWRALFREEIAWRELAHHAAALLGQSALFLALAFRRFRRREEP